MTSCSTAVAVMGRAGLEHERRRADGVVLLAAAERRERRAAANGFENTVVTTEAAHTGRHSLKFNMPSRPRRA